ncbi:MAG: hypothetical protein PHH39_11565 [Methanothrix soehngenii]|nr:hypothetical protein [Methanothrix soehngenii]
MLYKNEKGNIGIIDSVLAGVVTIIGVMIVINVNTAANFQDPTISTMTNLLGLVLAAGGIIYIVINIFR